MPGGRPTKPLFELLRDESTGRRTQPLRPSTLARPPALPEAEVKPVPNSLPPPALDPEPVEGAPTDYVGEFPAPAGPLRALFQLAGETVQVSRYAALIACAVVLGAIFLIYVVAYRAGHDKGVKDYSARYLPPDSPPPAGVLTPSIRPSETLGQRDPRPAPPPAPPKTTPPGEKSRPAPTRPNPGFDDPTKPVLTATGAFDADPRTPGLNYLVLATLLTREDARLLVAFLGASGLEVVGVPTRVEDEGRAGNNPGSYKVVTLTGLTREQFRADDPLKAKLKNEGTRLGELWKDQHKNTIIKDTYWESLKP